MRKKSVALAVSPVAIASIELVSAAPARAYLADCTRSGVCLWQDKNFTGGIKAIPNQNKSYAALTNIDGDFNDKMSSWWNRMSDRDARWFYDINATGTSRCMNAADSNSYVGWWDNDEASSVMIYTDRYACS